MAAKRTVRDSEGRVAEIIETRNGQTALRLTSGETIMVDSKLLTEEGEAYTLPFAFSEAKRASQAGGTVPVIEETAQVSKERVQAGGVRLTKTVSEREETIDEPLLKEDVSVERVSMNRVLEEPVGTRTEGETTIIPVLEEVLVVEKRLMLKEELHVKKRQTQVSEPQQVTLRSEHVEVEDLSSGKRRDD